MSIDAYTSNDYNALLLMLDNLKRSGDDSKYNMLYERGRVHMRGTEINIFFDMIYRLEVNNIDNRCLEMQTNLNNYTAFVLCLRVPSNNGIPLHDNNRHMASAKIILDMILQHIDNTSCTRNASKQPFFKPNNMLLEVGQQTPTDQYATLYSAIFESERPQRDKTDKQYYNVEIIVYTLLEYSFKRYILDKLIEDKVLTKMYPTSIIDDKSYDYDVPLYTASPYRKCTAVIEHVRHIDNLTNTDTKIASDRYDITHKSHEFSVIFERPSGIITKPICYPSNDVAAKLSLDRGLVMRSEQHKILIKDLEIAEAADLDMRTLRLMLDIVPSTDFATWYRIYNSIPLKYGLLRQYFMVKAPAGYADRVQSRINLVGILDSTVSYDVAFIETIIQQHDPIKYNEIKEKQPTTFLEQTILQRQGRLAEYDVAKYLYYMFSYKFRFDDNDETNTRVEQWYEFMTDKDEYLIGELYKWTKRSSPITINRYMSEALRATIDKYATHYNMLALTSNNTSKTKNLVFISDRLKKISDKLGTTMFKENILKQAKILFAVRGFIKSLDENGNLLGVGNGIVVLGKEPRLITTIHNYRISRYTTVNVDPKWANDSTILSYYKSIFKEPDAEHKIRMYFASSLDGCDKLGKMLIMIGRNGSNGKSSFIETHANSLGQYADKIPSSIHIDSRRTDSKEANSAMEVLFISRFTYSSENKKGASLSVDIIKEILGNEKVSNRQVYGRQHSGYIKCRLVHSTNNVLKLSEVIYAMVRRLLIYNMKYTFKTEQYYNPGNEDEKLVNIEYMKTYKMDKIFLEKYLSNCIFNDYACYMSKYNGDIDAVLSQTIDTETTNYFTSQDLIFQFITCRVVLSPRHETYTMAEIVVKYKEWYLASVGNVIPKDDDIVQDFNMSALEKYLTISKEKGTYILQYHRILNKNERFRGDDEHEFNNIMAYESLRGDITHPVEKTPSHRTKLDSLEEDVAQAMRIALGDIAPILN